MEIGKKRPSEEDLLSSSVPYMTSAQDLDVNAPGQVELMRLLKEEGRDFKNVISQTLEAINMAGVLRKSVPLEVYQRVCYELYKEAQASGNDLDHLKALIVWETVAHSQACDRISRQALGLIERRESAGREQTQQTQEAPPPPVTSEQHPEQHPEQAEGI